MMRFKHFFRLVVIPFLLLSYSVTMQAQCDPPVGNANQTLIVTYTLADLEVEGNNLTWYAEPSLTTELAEDTEAANGVTYYVTQTTGACESAPLAITVTLDYPAVTVSTGQYTVEELVEDVLIDSPCAFVDNITWSTGTNFGSTNNGIGYFENTNPTFPMERGIVLATGNVNQVPGPWVGGELAGGWPGDDDLFDYIQGLGIDPQLDDYNDATIIEFDFQANSDQMSFNLLFASGEYGQWQCQFADAFAFFLTNTKTGLMTNLALVPGTDDPISVLTIRDNAYNAICPSVNPEYFRIYNVRNPTQAATNFHEETTKITASSDVEPGVVDPIKLVIANRNDHSLDSAIFIEGVSFQIGAPDSAGDKLIVDVSALCSDEPYVLDTQLSAD